MVIPPQHPPASGERIKCCLEVVRKSHMFSWFCCPWRWFCLIVCFFWIQLMFLLQSCLFGQKICRLDTVNRDVYIFPFACIWTVLAVRFSTGNGPSYGDWRIVLGPSCLTKTWLAVARSLKTNGCLASWFVSWIGRRWLNKFRRVEIKCEVSSSVAIGWSLRNWPGNRSVSP